VNKHQTFGIPLLKWRNQNSFQNLTRMTCSFAEHVLGVPDCKDGIEMQNKIWFMCIEVSSAFHESFEEIPKFEASATSLVLASRAENWVPHCRSLSITSYDETSIELE
jgi:hypothetical protein